MHDPVSHASDAGRDLAAILEAVETAGLAWRGAFHPAASQGVPALSDGAAAGTLALLGFAGHAQWPGFADSAEARDGRPDALDRWSRRIVDDLARRLGAMALYPFGRPPYLPFHEWARAAEPVFASPLGILIHPRWGLWHAYRGALAFRERLALPPPVAVASPCESCAGRPCLGACPVGAFQPGRYDVARCAAHLQEPAGGACLGGGCLARHACPVGAEHRYGPAQASFHMRAFLASRP